MVEVFKTNVLHPSQAKNIIALLRQCFPDSKINFDLDDCDKILRVEGAGFCLVKIMQLLNESGFKCVSLEE